MSNLNNIQGISDTFFKNFNFNFNFFNSNNLPKFYKIKNFYLNKDNISQFTNFINSHYLIDDNLSIYYDEQLLKWYFSFKTMIKALFFKKELIGVLCGNIFISKIYNKKIKSLDINFFCIHQDFRNQNLAKFLITSFVLEALKKKITIATFTGKKKLNCKINDVCYYHRPLNIKKLVKLEFIKFNDYSDFILEEIFKVNEINNNIKISIANEKNLNILFNLYKKQIKKYNHCFIFSKKDFKYRFFNENIIFLEIKKEDKIIDFISFIKMKYVSKNKEIINIAQIYYFSNINIKLKEYFNNIILIFQKLNYDLINLLNYGEINNLLKHSNFFKILEGTGKLNNFILNFNTKNIEINKTFKHII